jgi:murein DD-endopeptidase MepM/ murein hydrolase activator NlpD
VKTERVRGNARGSAARLLVVLLAVLAIVLVFRRTSPRVASTGPANAAYAGVTPAPPGPPPERDPYYVVRGEDIPDGRRFFVRNVLGGPIQIELKFDEVDNMHSDPELPLRVTIPGASERSVVDLRQTETTRGANFTLAWSAALGSPSAVHSGAARYRVPFRDGVLWTLDQTFGGRFSHQGAEARHALDFGVPVGTTVLAARGGVVMQLDDTQVGGGDDFTRYGDRANFVRVVHEDGTMGVYAHLETGSAMLRVGDRVEAGAPLARSGATGYVSGPHLHFAVQVNAGMRLESVPFDMDDVDEHARER